jgi:flagellar basal body P-ring formation protein FlgA
MKMYDKFLPEFRHLQALFTGVALLSWGVSATSYSMSDLTTHTTTWLEQQAPDPSVNKLKIQVYPLDNRLPDKNCEQSLQTSLVNVQLQRQNTVRIQCPDTGGWQLFVSVKVSQLVNAVAVTRQLAAGSYLSNDLLVQTETDLLQSRGALVKEAQLIVGARTKKALNSGQIITQNDLCLVCKGDVVTIAGVSNGLSVTTQATALQDGTLGDEVRVQNLQSKRVVTAQITAVKRVEIKL